jgi:nicotinamide-nucleotide amidase
VRGAVLAIGDELVSGYQLDTNSQVISRWLATIPVDVVMHLSVGDDPRAIDEGLDFTLRAAEVVLVTGGLGPTEDDLTRQVIAAHFELELVEDAEALARIRDRFARRGRTMPDSNRIQARVPAGCRIIQNDRGTASGFHLEVDDRHIFVTPGIPYEMEGMLESYILPQLRQLAGSDRYVAQRMLKVYGLPESEINERIRDLMVRGRNPLLGLLPNLGTITVEVIARGSAAAEAEALVLADVETLRARLAGHIISENGEDLPEVVAGMLAGRELTIATLEWGTGGMVAAQLSRPEGAGRCYRGGTVIAPEADDPADVGEEAVRAMAASVRQSAGADIGVGVGPIVQVPGASRRRWGALWAAVDLHGEPLVQQLNLSGDRDHMREWAAGAVLGLVRQRLLGD